MSGAGEEQGAADDQPAGTLGGDVEHDQEEAEEQQARAEVVLEDQDAEADQPHGQDRAEVAPARQVDEEHPAPGQGQRVAVQHEVAGEGDHQQHLGDLAGLEAERAEVIQIRAPLTVVPMPGTIGSSSSTIAASPEV